jgi:hypothetical protein
VVNDRRASLDEGEVKKSTQTLVRKDFETRATVPLFFFQGDADAIPDSPRLTLLITDAETEWDGQSTFRDQIAGWTARRGKSPHLYPASLVWCIRKPGRDLRDRVEIWLAWKRVEHEIAAGTLGGEYEKAEKAEVADKVRDTEEGAKDEVWASHRYVVLGNQKEPGGLKAIDLGAGHASGAESLSGRVLAALKSQGLLNESVGAGYLERNWPPAFKESGAWPLSGLRQSFLNGAHTRLLDPDVVLRGKIPEFVGRGELGLASGQQPDGSLARVWWNELAHVDEATFDGDVYLLTKGRARGLKSEPLRSDAGIVPAVGGVAELGGSEATPDEPHPVEVPREIDSAAKRPVRVSGIVPPEVWNRLGTRLIPKLKSGSDLRLGINATFSVAAATAASLQKDIEQALNDLGLSEQMDVDVE